MRRPGRRLGLGVALAAAGSVASLGCSSPRPPAAGATPTRSDAIAVPRGAAPAVDGVVGDAEWSAAVAIPLGRGAMLRLVHDGARVYLGISGAPAAPGQGFGCVMIAGADRVRVLHASYKLGSAIYDRGADGAFHPRSTDYAWKDAATMLRDEGWMASLARAGDGGIALAFLGADDLPPSLTSSARDLEIDADGGGDALSQAIAVIDYNGDGFHDLAVGAPESGADNSGNVHVFLGFAGAFRDASPPRSVGDADVVLTAGPMSASFGGALAE
ncbi:MAG TPA: FG-GAP repeat protein [Kofleriaceae bacterium]|nr:FG-GAP repeat protein [Kofleriaceae bacterium]